MSVEIDLNGLCLVCLRKATKYHSIYDNDEENLQMSIIEKITKCSDLKVSSDSAKLPDKLCTTCYGDLQAAWRFRQNCKEASTVFQYIQQQDEESEVFATLELESQQIKLPLGLKIKKMITTAAETSKTRTLAAIIAKSKKKMHNITENEAHVYDIVTHLPKTTTITTTTRTRTTNEPVEIEDVASNIEEDEEETAAVDDIYMPDEETDDDDVDEDEEGDEEEEEEEEILGDTRNSSERHTVICKKVKIETEDDGKMKLAEISSGEIKRGRGRPRKSTHTVMPKTITTIVDNKILNLNKNSSTAKVTTGTRRRRAGKNELRSPKICEICGNGYKYQHALNAHMRRHNNVRPYSCEFCQKSFVACVELQRHMRVHTGHKPYACNYCERRFSDFGSRLKHERTHTGERPYTCDTCHKSFAYAHVLSVHLRTHTGEKRFQCQRCGRGFTKKAYLQAHLTQLSGRQNCMAKEQEMKSALQADDCNYTEEFIVEELNEQDNEMLQKHQQQQVTLKYEYDDTDNIIEEDLTEEGSAENFTVKGGIEIELDDENMTEEHLDDEETELVFEIR